MKKNAPRKKKIETESDVPQDLRDLLGSINALATIHDLMAVEGMYPHKCANAVAFSIEYVKAIHQESLKSALAHKDADKVEMLKKMKISSAAEQPTEVEQAVQ